MAWACAHRGAGNGGDGRGPGHMRALIVTEPIFGMHVASVGLVYCFSKILLTIFVKIVNYYVFGANYSAHHYYYLMSNMLFFMQFCCLSHDEIHVGVQS